MALFSSYLKDVYSQLRYRATWLPGTPVELGEVGELDKGVFNPITSLANLGITFDVDQDAAPDGSLDYKSAGRVNVVVKAAGELKQQFSALAEADAGVLVEFTDSNAAVLELRGVTIDRIKDIPALKRTLLERVLAADDQARWDRDWVVVTHVVRAASGTILIAGGESSRLELKASASIAPTSLADAKAGLTRVLEHNVSTTIVAKHGLVPLYKGLRVKQNFWWLYDEVIVASDEEPEADEVFDDADPEADPTVEG